MLYLPCLQQCSIIGFAGVFQKYAEDLPDLADYRIPVPRVADGFVEHLVEANSVHEKRSVDAIDIGHRNLGADKPIPFDSVPSERQLMRGLDQNAWDLKGFSLSKSLVQPGFQDLGSAGRRLCIRKSLYRINGGTLSKSGYGFWLYPSWVHGSELLLVRFIVVESIDFEVLLKCLTK